MWADEIDRYLAALDEPKRSTLEAVRRTILEILPDAEQGLAYGVPAFTVAGRAVAGFAAFERHLSYLPHSATVLTTLGDEVAGYETSKGSLRFAIDEPLPKALIAGLLAARLDELARSKHRRRSPRR